MNDPYLVVPRPVVVNGVLYGKDADVANIVMARINFPAGARRGFDNPTCALGVMVQDKLVGGVVFHNYRQGVDMEISIWMETPRWARKSTLTQLYSYPFVQLQLPRITAITSRKNRKVRRLLRGIGWKEEGVIRRAFDGEVDAIIYGQLKEECRFLKDPVYGQISAEPAAAA